MSVLKISFRYFFIIKPTRSAKFTNLFWHETLHVSNSSSLHHQDFIHSTLSNDICYTTFEQDQGTAVSSWSCSKAVYKPVRHIPLLSLQWINSWWWTEELFETCTVSCQNKFVKLVHLICFIIKKFFTMHGHTNVKKNPFGTSVDHDVAKKPYPICMIIWLGENVSLELLPITTYCTSWIAEKWTGVIGGIVNDKRNRSARTRTWSTDTLSNPESK
jgi:hypothetical protein